MEYIAYLLGKARDPHASKVKDHRAHCRGRAQYYSAYIQCRRVMENAADRQVRHALTRDYRADNIEA